MNDEQILTTEPVVVNYIHSKTGVSKKGRAYTLYSIKLLPFHGDDVVVDEGEAFWISAGFSAPKLNVGDLVQIHYIETGDQRQWKNMDSFEYIRDSDKAETRVVNNAIDINQDIPY